MNIKEIHIKARELIECLGMWNIGIDDALEIAHAMKIQLRDLSIMPNPLAGTGLKAIQDIDPTKNSVKRARIKRARIFHEPESEQ